MSGLHTVGLSWLTLQQSSVFSVLQQGNRKLTLRKERDPRWHGSKWTMCAFKSEGRAENHLFPPACSTRWSQGHFSQCSTSINDPQPPNWSKANFQGLTWLFSVSVCRSLFFITSSFSSALASCFFRAYSGSKWEQYIIPEYARSSKLPLGCIDEGPRKILSCTKSANKFRLVH